MTDETLDLRLREALDVAPAPDLAARIRRRLDAAAPPRHAAAWRFWLAGGLAAAVVSALFVAPRTPVTQPEVSLPPSGPTVATTTVDVPVRAASSVTAVRRGGAAPRARGNHAPRPRPAVSEAIAAAVATEFESAAHLLPDTAVTPHPSTAVAVERLEVEPVAIPPIGIAPLDVMPLETDAPAREGDPR